MDHKKRIVAIAFLYLRRKRRRSVWVHQILCGRQQQGEYHRLVQELRLDDVLFQLYFRLSKGQFDNLLGRVGPRITRINTSLRQAIGAAERLAICLSVQLQSGHSTVAGIVKEVAEVIWLSLLNDFMPIPSSEDWESIAEGFYHHWNFPNCLGSIDGKHVVIQAPPNSGSLYHNYKGTFSIALLAVVDADCLFRVVDIGGYGRTSDGGSLYNSAFGERLRDGTLQLPEDTVISGSDHRGPIPHVFVGDEAFPLRSNLMRPFPGTNLPREQRVFNYRLSRARLVVECAFGILSSQWRMYRRVIGVSPATAEVCVKATCILHNFFRVTSLRGEHRVSNPNPAPEDDTNVALQEVSRMGTNNATREAITIRGTFTSFFNQEGAVSWQDRI
uniref:DDE Tnp4 domain-containing protein n=1 Tax=Astyanax mexicanus TaxID=7994 RepID=A0A3B1JES6_ASTMX